MLHNAPCKCETSLKVDGLRVEFSLESKETKASTHTLRVLLGLIA